MKLLEIKNVKGSLGIMHFIGIGGIGMSGIAEILFNLGYKIQGSDIASNANTLRLSAMGIKIFTGHVKENVAKVEYVIISSAIKPDNPELLEAQRLKIPVVHRSEMLSELMKLKTSIAVSGSHGKTTTTSLIAAIFEKADLKPTVVNGGIINHRQTNAYLGQGDYLIAEADESDATFIKIPSTIAVITNLDPEHMDFYQTFDKLIAAFKSFITNLPFYGFAVACIDHPVVKELITDINSRKVITYGIDSENADVYGFNINTTAFGSTYDVRIKLPGRKEYTIEKVFLPVLGKHNVLNSLAAIAISAEMDFDQNLIKNGFKDFKGVKRRFTNIGAYSGISFVDDYAHHPAEIKATLQTARDFIKLKNNGKIIVIYQPHRYSRLKHLFEDFVKSFDLADVVYIADVYSAGEAEIPGATSKALVEAISNYNKNLKIFLLDSEKDLASIIKKVAEENDIVLFMGAGTITQWAYKTFQTLLDAQINNKLKLA